MRKIFLITVLLITNLIANCFTDANQVSTKGDNAIQNDIIIQNVEIAENNLINFENAEESTQENIVENISKNEEIQKINKTEEEDVTVDETQVKKEVASTKENNEETSTELATTSTQQVITTNIEEVQNNVTESELEYWCVAGGNHHIAGDGENEHGYYATWDLAYSAFEEYTKEWNSVQFKIDTCACGLYYFWAVQN